MDFRKFQDMVEATMDLTKVDKFEYVVKPDFDDMLKSEYSHCDIKSMILIRAILSFC